MARDLLSGQRVLRSIQRSNRARRGVRVLRSLELLAASAAALGCSDPERAQEAAAPHPRSSAATYARFQWALRRLGSEPSPGAVRATKTGVRVGGQLDREGSLSIDAEAGDRFRLKTGELNVAVQRRSGGGAYRRLGEVALGSEIAPGVDSLLFMAENGIEELCLVKHPSASLSYDFELPRGFSLSLAESAPEATILDREGRARVRVSFPRLWDADDREFRVRIALENGRRLTVLPTPGARYPILVDPIWQDAAGPGVARFRHTATLLLDGNVLVAGGASRADPSQPAGNADALASVELYRTEMGTFEALGELGVARAAHTATLLRDGRVLIAGGFDEHGDVLDSAELYDPGAGLSEAAASLHEARGLHTATHLGDGRVLIAGGATDASASRVASSAEIFDPEARAFEVLEVNGTPSVPSAAALMGDGNVWFVWPSSKTWQIFDSEAQAFRKPSALPEGLGLDVVLWRIEDARALALGPSSFTTLPSSTPAPAEELPSNGELVDTGLGSSSAGAVLSGAYWRLGGLAATGAPSPAAARLDVGGSSLASASSSMRDARAFATATTHPGGGVLVVGGIGSRGALRAAELLEEWPAQGRAVNLPILAPGYAALLVPDGRVLIMGGEETTGVNPLADDPTESTADNVLAYDGAGVAFTGSLAARRNGHSAILTTKGVLIGGGVTSPEDAPEELWDLETNRSKPLRQRLEARGAGIRIGRTQALFAGRDFLELFDVESDQLERIALPWSGAACPASLARMPSGRVVVVGEQAATELELEGRLFSSPLTFAERRCDRVVVPLPDGTALISGGHDSSGQPSRRSDFFDPLESELRRAGDLREKTRVLGGRVWFDEALLYGNEFIGVDWRRGEWATLYQLPTGPLSTVTLTPLPDGSLLELGASKDSGGGSTFEALLFSRGSNASVRFDLGASRIVRQGAEVTIKFSFSALAAEQSSGTTSSSPTNSPVPVWIPAGEGWPKIGSFLSWSSTRAVWKVPETPYPGSGFLCFANGDQLKALGPVEILPREQGEPCAMGGQCVSAQCVDGVCCATRCAGSCEACRARDTGVADGTCSPVLRGTAEDSCIKQEVSTCGLDGTCDERGACARYPDGEACSSGASCRSGACVPDLGCSSAELECGAYRCSRTTDACLTRCEGDPDCAFGFTCVEAACVARQPCVEDGVPLDCGAYRCSLVTGACLKRCETNHDCAAGLACSSAGACEAPLPPIDGQAIGCGLMGRSPRTPAWYGLLPLICLSARRARARKGVLNS